MKQNNMTAVDWYFDKIKSHFEHDGELFESAVWTYEQAKQMEKEQIMKAYHDDNFPCSHYGAEQYYNETYGK